MRNTRDRFTVTVHRRVRYWTDGAVIGSEIFVCEVAATLTDAKRALRKRLAKGTPPHSGDAPPLFAYRRLDPTLWREDSAMKFQAIRATKNPSRHSPVAR